MSLLLRGSVTPLVLGRCCSAASTRRSCLRRTSGSCCPICRPIALTKPNGSSTPPSTDRLLDVGQRAWFGVTSVASRLVDHSVFSSSKVYVSAGQLELGGHKGDGNGPRPYAVASS